MKHQKQWYFNHAKEFCIAQETKMKQENVLSIFTSPMIYSLLKLSLNKQSNISTEYVEVKITTLLVQGGRRS